MARFDRSHSSLEMINTWSLDRVSHTAPRTVQGRGDHLESLKAVHVPELDESALLARCAAVAPSLACCLAASSLTCCTS